MNNPEELFFDSRDKESKIHAMLWRPAETPICILQIIHGMAEHISCYSHFAMAMAERGILVVGEDHLGHGDSVSEGGTYGYFCKEEAATVVVRDVHRLKKMIQEQNPGIPYYILGHSMGSFILRNYLLRYGKGIDGAIIVGTGMQPKMTIALGKAMTRVLALFQGWKHHSTIMNGIAFGMYNKGIQNLETEFDWICTDKNRVNSYVADEACGFTFTLNGFHTLFTLLEGLTKEGRFQAIPKDLPVLISSGTQDPVGAYGKHVTELYETYRHEGMTDVTCKLYDNMRHEIMNEQGKEIVYQDIYQWIKCHIDKRV